MKFKFSKKSTIMVTGAGGLLGERVTRQAEDRGYDVVRHFHHPPRDRPPGKSYAGDLSAENHVIKLAHDVSPALIINCAALANVDRCEREIGLSRRINVGSVENIVKAFARVKIIHISTDYVFPGKKEKPKPGDPPDPINVYGQHKLETEGVVLAASADNLIVRSVILFDNVEKRNFFRFVYWALKEGKRVNGITDQYANPISALGAADMILGLIEQGAAGIWHVGGADYVNRFEFAQRIAGYFGLDESLVDPITSGEISRPAARPELAGLDVSDTEMLLKISAPSLEDEFARIK